MAIITRKDEAREVGAALYDRISPLCKKHNSRHVTLSYQPGTSFGKMRSGVECFVDKLGELAGVQRSRIAYAGIAFMKPGPHVHLVALSDKSRATGRSVGNMPVVSVEKLFAWWTSFSGSSAKWRGVYDPTGLVDYHTGGKNLLRTAQEYETIEAVNLDFIARLEKRKSRREACRP